MSNQISSGIWEVITDKISSEKVEVRFTKIGSAVFLQRCVLKKYRCCCFSFRGAF